MNTAEAVGKGIAYIEDNLRNDIGVADVAGAAAYSQFYFSREFSLRAHISVYDYILRRKLSEAYKELFSSGPRIIDLAFGYGFQSHEVFTRAFRKMFGENPSGATVYKPLLVYERVSGPYLAFLDGLKTDAGGGNCDDCRFEVESAADYARGGAFLLVLSDDRLCVRAALGGQVKADGGGGRLSFSLGGLGRVCRICRPDITHALRYYFDNAHDPARMAGNYILLKKEAGHIDIIAPVR